MNFLLLNIKFLIKFYVTILTNHNLFNKINLIIEDQLGNKECLSKN